MSVRTFQNSLIGEGLLCIGVRASRPQLAASLRSISDWNQAPFTRCLQDFQVSDRSNYRSRRVVRVIVLLLYSRESYRYVNRILSDLSDFHTVCILNDLHSARSPFNRVSGAGLHGSSNRLAAQAAGAFLSVCLLSTRLRLG